MTGKWKSSVTERDGEWQISRHLEFAVDEYDILCLEMNKPQLVTFPNGLSLITVSMPQVESVTVMVGIGAGSRYETKSSNGLFHFLEHMAFKGTKKRPSTLAIATEVDAIGGAFNAFTSKELTGYFIKAAAKHTSLVFDVLSDMLTNSLFKEEEIEREKGVIIEEINMYEDTPTRRVWEVFERLLYGDNPMGWDIAGEKETIKSVSREILLSRINRLYSPAKMAVVAAGKLKEKELFALTKEYFGDLAAKPKTEARAIKLEQKTAKIKLVYKKTEQAHFCLGVPAYNLFNPKRFAEGILSVILGGGMSSRLFIEIRERRGLAYYISCLPELFTDSGYFVVNAGVSLTKIEEAIKASLDQMYKLTAKKVSDKELKKAKEFVKGGFILSLENSQHVAEGYTSQVLLEGKLVTPEEKLRLVDKVTAGDVQRAARDIFKPENLNLALIGPYKEEDRFAKLLNL